MWLGEDAYIDFYLDRKIYPKKEIKITIYAADKWDKMKIFKIQDDKTKDIIAEFKYKKHKSMAFTFDVPKSYIQKNGEVKLNILFNKVKKHNLESYGMIIEGLKIEIN